MLRPPRNFPFFSPLDAAGISGHFPSSSSFSIPLFLSSEFLSSWREKKMVFKNIPHCKVSGNTTLGTSMVGRCRSQQDFPGNCRAQLPCPLIAKEKRSKMWNVHPKSGLFAEKTQPKVFPTSPGSFSRIKWSRGEFPWSKEKSSCKLPRRPQNRPSSSPCSYKKAPSWLFWGNPGGVKVKLLDLAGQEMGRVRLHQKKFFPLISRGFFGAPKGQLLF